MSIVTLLIALLVLGFLAWAIGFLPFIAPPFKQIIRGVLLFVAVILLLFWVLGLLGVSGVPDVNIR